MKKTFESGKIWTFLSALLFFMTCGIFIVHAASSSNTTHFYDTYNATGMDNKLTATGWDDLMGDLDKLIPDGAVMAFVTDRCPDGWTPFNEANGRFLMGTSGGILSIGGTTEVTLRANQLPPHQHYLRYGGAKHYAQSHDGRRSVIVDRDTGKYPYTPEKPQLDMENLSSYSYSTGNVSTAPFGYRRGENQDTVNIINPFIKVRYCIKGNNFEFPTKTVSISRNSSTRGSVFPATVTNAVGAEIIEGHTTAGAGHLKIGDSDVIASPASTKRIKVPGGWQTTTFSFDHWENNCGGTLENDCTIKAHFTSDVSYQESCFIAGSQVTMSNGTQKNIEDVKIGEKVLGSNGSINTVLGYERPTLGNRHLWSINGGEYFVSDEHPFMTTEGWKSFNPKMTKLEIDLDTTELKIGDILITNNGLEKIKSLDYINADYNVQLYNLVLDGDHTYYVNNYLVHNKGSNKPGDEPTVPIE